MENENLNFNFFANVSSAKVMLISSSFNGMTQYIARKLEINGYKNIKTIIYSNELSIESLIDSVEKYNPEIIFCPFMKTPIPEQIYSKFICLIVHPGIIGDRGAYSLDWVILNQTKTWGVTMIQACKEMDSGDIWATKNFEVNLNFNKSTIYNKQIVPIAMDLVLECLSKLHRYLLGEFKPKKLDYSNPEIKGKLHGILKQNNPFRIINWKEDLTEEIIKKINAADTQPGIKANLILNGKEITRFLYGCIKETYLKPSEAIQLGEIFARRSEAVCVKTIDGAIWIKQIRNMKSKENPIAFKVPSVINLQKTFGNEIFKINENEKNCFFKCEHNQNTFQEIFIEIISDDKIAIVNFDFYNGAMTKFQCNRLKNALENLAINERIKVIVLAGSKSNWSNGINLNVIEFAEDPQEEAWENLLAINKLIRLIILMKNKIVISALQANAGAGGVYFALAADFIFAEKEIVLNPHYINMGLYGSEFHTLLGQRRIGLQKLFEIKETAKPMITEEAIKIGFIDDLEKEFSELNDYSFSHKGDINKSFKFLEFDKTKDFMENIKNFSCNIINCSYAECLLNDKLTNFNDLIERDILENCENSELEEMHEDIFNNRNLFCEKRKKFVLKN